MLINRTPKFCNDDEYADELAARLMKDFKEIVDARSKLSDVRGKSGEWIYCQRWLWHV